MKSKIYNYLLVLLISIISIKIFYDLNREVPEPIDLKILKKRMNDYIDIYSFMGNKIELTKDLKPLFKFDSLNVRRKYKLILIFDNLTCSSCVEEYINTIELNKKKLRDKQIQLNYIAVGKDLRLFKTYQKIYGLKSNFFIDDKLKTKKFLNDITLPIVFLQNSDQIILIGHSYSFDKYLPFISFINKILTIY